MSNPRYVELAFNQVQDNMGLTNMSNPRNLDLAVNKVQGNDHPPLARLRERPSSLGTPKKMTILSWHVQRNEIM